MSDISTLQKLIHEENKAKGFWDDRKAIPVGMEVTKHFTPDEIKFVKGAIVSQMLMLIVSEISEAQEALRKGRGANMKSFDTDMSYADDPAAINFNEMVFKNAFSSFIKDTFEDELADATIRIFDLAAGLGIDLERHIELKRKYNKTRPYKHGKSC